MANKNSLVVFSLVISSVLSTPSIPVLTWWYGNGLKNSAQTSKILSGHTIDQASVFTDYLKSTLTESKFVLLFIEDQLSIDDFTKNPGSFPFVKESLNNQKHLLFPSTSQEKSSLLQNIQGGLPNSNVVEFSSSDDDWSAKLSEGSKPNSQINVFIVHLEPVGDADDKSKKVIFGRNDASMKSITSKLLERSNELTVIYTSSEPSKLVSNLIMNEEVMDGQLKSRHLLSTNDDAQVVINKNGSFLMVYSGIKFGMASDMKSLNFSSDDVTFDNNTVSFSSDASDFKMSMTFKERVSEWHCDTIKVENGTGFNLTFDCGDDGSDLRAYTSNEVNTIIAPLQYSFQCPKMTFVVTIGKGEEKQKYVLEFSKMQVQLKNKGSFSGAYSCVGFFSIPILTGLLVGLLLVASLFMGIMMMMNIQTQDRFDDPKGKTITVHTGE